MLVDRPLLHSQFVADEAIANRVLLQWVLRRDYIGYFPLKSPTAIGVVVPPRSREPKAKAKLPAFLDTGYLACHCPHYQKYQHQPISGFVDFPNRKY